MKKVIYKIEDHILNDKSPSLASDLLAGLSFLVCIFACFSLLSF